MPEAAYALAVRDLRKRFGPLEVLRGVSLTANDGDVISILGSSGSGKSTFLRCINLLETPDEGIVSVAGETIKMRRRRDGRSEPADRRPATMASIPRRGPPLTSSVRRERPTS